MTVQATSVDDAALWMSEAAAVTVLTGAGISTASGIPDFRGPEGVWTKNPGAQQMFTIDNYLADPEVRRQAWRARLSSPVWSAEPNAGHRALFELERAGRMRAIVTQNTDGLHQRAGSSPERVIEVHGTARRVRCMECDHSAPMREVLPRLEAGETDPPCPDCGGILKSATISFGQNLERAVLASALDASRGCDLFLAVGTSLTVYPVAALCDYAIDDGARLILVNAEPTPYDRSADAVLREPISDVLPRLVAGAVGRS